MATFRDSIDEKINRELKSHFGSPRIRNIRIQRWTALLEYLRRSWLDGDDTLLETGLYERFHKENRIIE